MKNLFLTMAAFLFSLSALATPPINSGSVSTATGGSGRGTTEPIDGVLLNPAMIGLLSSKILSATYTNQQWGVTIADNGKEALFPAALAFVRTDVEGFKTQQVSVGLSYVFKKMFAIGTNLSLLEYSSEAINRDEKYRQSVADIGLMFSPGAEFGVGLVANKVASSTTDLDETLQKQQTLGLGFQYTYLSFVRFRFDIESGPKNKTERLVYMGGVETYMNDWMILRFGYQNNNVVSKNYSTVGLGFAGPQFSLHYAYISNVANNRDDQHSIDLGIPF